MNCRYQFQSSDNFHNENPTQGARFFLLPYLHSVCCCCSILLMFFVSLSIFLRNFLLLSLLRLLREWKDNSNFNFQSSDMSKVLHESRNCGGGDCDCGEMIELDIGQQQQAPSKSIEYDHVLGLLIATTTTTMMMRWLSGAQNWKPPNIWPFELHTLFDMYSKHSSRLGFLTDEAHHEWKKS